MEAIQIHVYRPTALLKVTGEDAAGFLQGQFTNELRQTPGSVAYGLWLNQKGKIVADAWVLRLAGNEFYVTSIASPAAVIQQRLEDYIVADDVVLADETATAHGLALWGAKTGEKLAHAFGAVPAAGQFAQAGGLLVFAGRRVSGENYEIFGPEKNIRELCERLKALGGREVDADQTEFARIAAGIPAIPQDLGPGDLPNEGGLEGSAISYTKGCYLGQEVMARLKNLGQVRRRLYVLQGAGEPPRPRTPLYQGEKKVGEARSAARRGGEFLSLAMLSLLNFNPAVGLSSAPGAPPTLYLSPPHG